MRKKVILAEDADLLYPWEYILSEKDIDNILFISAFNGIEPERILAYFISKGKDRSPKKDYCRAYSKILLVGHKEIVDFNSFMIENLNPVALKAYEELINTYSRNIIYWLVVLYKNRFIVLSDNGYLQLVKKEFPRQKFITLWKTRIRKKIKWHLFEELFSNFAKYELSKNSYRINPSSNFEDYMIELQKNAFSSK